MGDTTLGELATITTGWFGRSTKGKRTPVVKIADIGADGRLVPRTKLESIPKPAQAERAVVKAGDVLLAGRGAKTKAAVVGRTHAGVIASSNVLILRPGKGVRGKDLVAFLLSDEGRRELEARRSGTVIRTLTVESLRAMPVSLGTAGSRAG
jgi:hypothetical protein